MESSQATQFSRYSVSNASKVKSTLSCGCEPYKDVFTYNRWQAQGMQVMRGEKSIKLPVIIDTEDKETMEHHKRFWTSSVFCRHQVKRIGSKPEPMPTLKAESAKVESTPTGDDIMQGWRVI